MLRLNILAAICYALMSVAAPPANASVLYSNLGPPGSVYNTIGWTINGTDGGIFANSNTDGMLFTVSGSGSLPVTEIDLALVTGLTNDSTFVASIWTDSAGAPGAQLAGASWSGSTSVSDGSCCSLVSITGISGVDLTGGAQYFLVVGPSSLTGASNIAWEWNTIGLAGVMAHSTDGGASWLSSSGQTLGVFDVLSNPNTATPIPAALPLFASGLGALGLLGWRRKRKAALAA